MKYCPKCNEEHAKSGTFCSRSCANSRVQTEEMNRKRSEKLSGKKTSIFRPTNLEQWRANLKQAWLDKYNSTPFEKLGCENRRRRVFEEQNYCCNRCGISEWQGFKISLELDHKDGNSTNNSRDNLEGLCPNCHSVTDTWRGRNKPRKNGQVSITDEQLLEFLRTSKSIREGLLRAGLSARGNNYTRAKKLLGIFVSS
jgi:5-methylcytosine-specific restriction endonuclease McrA